MNIVFLGPPGSGKGTQAKRLAEKFGLNHLSTGDIFRAAIQSESILGKKIKDFVTSGKLVPDELVSQVVFENLKTQKRSNGFLLDGYPRTREQAETLAEFSSLESVAIDLVLFLDVSEDELVKRLSARRQCPKCKEVYNLESRPPKTPNVCDLCGTTLIQREDDKAEVVKDRLTVYQKQTAPILSYYHGKRGFHKIEAGRDIDQVFGDIVSILQAHESHVQ